MTISPIKDDAENIIGASAIAHDISERKRLEDELRRTSMEIEDLYNNAPCGYHSLDKNGVFIRINDTELKWLGYTREEIIGKVKVTDLCTPESGAEFARNFSLLLETGYMHGLQIEFILKDCTTFPVLLSASAIKDSAGNFLMSRAVVYDMTERKKAEDELKRINSELQEALAKVKVLRGMLPICASCKKIRNEKGFWDSIEKYICEHSEAEFTHGLCVDCAKRLYPEFYDELK